MSKAKRIRAERAADEANAAAERERAERLESLSFSHKLDRAEAHIDCLEKSIQGWLEGGAYALIEHFNAETGDYLLEAKVSEPPSDRWPLLIGDAVHNLRSALDHIVYSLALDGYQTQHPGRPIPLNHQRRIQFPIVATSNDPRLTVDEFYKQAIVGQLRYVPTPAADSIAGLQPYKRLPADPSADPLWIVNELDVIDKHRKLHTVAVANPLQSLGFGRGASEVTIKDLYLNGGPVEGERQILKFSVETGDSMPLHMERQFARFVALTEGPGSVTTGEVVTVLRALHRDITTTVVPELAEYL